MAGQVLQVGSPDRPSYVYEDPDELDDPFFAGMHQYWEASRGERDIPAKSAFVPKNVKSHLPWLVVSDALPDGSDFVFRVVGTRVSDYFLNNSTGKTVTEAFVDAPNIGQGTLWLLRRTCELRRPMRYSGAAMIHKSVYFPSFDALYLPYSSDGVCADRIVTLFVFNYHKLRERNRLAQTSPALSVAG
jgi:hypothetical protein